MKYFHWPVVLLAALIQTAATEETSSKDGTAEPLGHIVVLKAGLENSHLRDHVEWVESLHKRSTDDADSENQEHGVKHTYEGGDFGFHAYAGKFTPAVLERIKRHEHVDFVEEDQIHTLEARDDEAATNSEPASSSDGRKSNNSKGRGGLATGQGYNTFLRKGATRNAVILHDEVKKRDGSPQEFILEGAIADFNFTPPITDFDTIDPSYFDAPDMDALIQEALAGLAQDRKNTTVPSNLQTRDEEQNDCNGRVHVDYNLVENYGTYLDSLDISAGATLSGWGQSASVSGNYLNKAEFSTNSIIYVAIISIERQLESPTNVEFNTDRYDPETFAKVFGDKWIQGFYEGGKMIARVTFKSKSQGSANDIKAQAHAAMSFWGASGEVDASTQKSMEDVNKHSQVEVKLSYEGELGAFMMKSGSPQAIKGDNAQAALMQAKLWADRFLENACKHRYVYRPVLDEYTTVDNFPENQEIPDYFVAERMSHVILSRLVVIADMKKYLLSRHDLDNTAKDDIEFDQTEMEQLSRDWVKTVAANPRNATASAREVLTKFETGFRAKYQHFMPHPYISGLKVVYSSSKTSEPPAGRVLEIHRKSDDVNSGQGGDYVWLVPLRTDDANKACTSFEVVIDTVPQGFQNLAQGTTHKSRYLKCITSSSKDKIRRLALYRPESARQSPPPGAGYQLVPSDSYRRNHPENWPNRNPMNTDYWNRGSRGPQRTCYSYDDRTMYCVDGASTGDSPVDHVRSRNGFKGTTSNINEGRSGDGLYLFWA